MNVQITDLRAVDEPKIQQVARLILEGFKEHWPDAWPDINSALQEVQESLGADRISRIAVGESNQVLGWIGGIKQYDPNVWEHIAKIRNLRGHPYEFYQKMGFAIVGVMPDANGIGKPDIFMAKRL